MKNAQSKITTNAGILVFVLMLCNFLNFIYNAYLGRVLSFEEYGLLIFVSTLGSILSVFVASLGSVINHRVSFLTTSAGQNNGKEFYKSTLARVFFVSIAFAVIWFVFSSYLSSFFNINNSLVVIFFSPIIVVSVFNAMGEGLLQSQLYFGVVALITFFETLSKLLIAYVFVLFGLNEWVYLSIPISFLVSFIMTVLFVSFIPSNDEKDDNYLTGYSFPFSFYFATLLSGLSTTAFLSVDVLLAKHYLSPAGAGQYAVLALVGKMVFFFGSFFSTSMITFIGRDLAAKRSTFANFYKLFTISAVFSFFAFTVLGPLGHLFVPILLGSKSDVIVPFLTLYCAGILFFTLSNIIVSYRLVRHEYVFPIVSILSAIFLVIGVSIRHNDPEDISMMVLISGMISFFIISIMHVVYDHGRYIFRNIVDLVDLIYPLDSEGYVPEFSGKRILIFNWRDTRHKNAGGAEVYVHELSKRWVSRGHKVTIFCGNDSVSFRHEYIDGVEIIRRGGFYMVYVWAFFYYLVRFRNQYDVIVDCENGIPFFTPLYTKEKQFLLIHHVHRDVFKRSLKPPFSNIAMFIETKVMPYVYDKVKIITVSPSSQKEILAENLTSDEVSVIYNGVDLEQYTPGEKDSFPLILYLGRLKKYKSVDIFLRAAQRVVNFIPNAKFVVAGDGEERNKLIKLADNLGISDKVEFLGKVSEEMKIDLYRRASVFVNPSFMEGWGITTIEANACGTPVVASRVSGLIDSVKNPHTGYLVEYGNDVEFAEKITKLLTDKKLWSSMSLSAIEWSKEFDWNKSAEKGLEVLFCEDKKN